MATLREEVEFKTLDGLTLRGVLFPAKKHSPAIILAPGVSYIYVTVKSISISAPRILNQEAFLDTPSCLRDVLLESTNPF